MCEFMLEWQCIIVKIEYILYSTTIIPFKSYELILHKRYALTQK